MYFNVNLKTINNLKSPPVLFTVCYNDIFTVETPMEIQMLRADAPPPTGGDESSEQSEDH